MRQNKVKEKNIKKMFKILSKKKLLTKTKIFLKNKTSFFNVRNLSGTKMNKDRGKQLVQKVKDLFKTKISEEERKRLQKGSIKRLFSLALTEKKAISIALVFLLITTGTALFMPTALGKMVDFASEKDPIVAKKKMNDLALLFCSVFTAGAVATFFRSSILQIAGERMVANLRKQLFSSILNKEAAFFDVNKTGELVNRLSTDTSIMSKSILESASFGLRRIVEGVGGIGFLLYLSPQLTSSMLFIVPPLSLGLEKNHFH